MSPASSGEAAGAEVEFNVDPAKSAGENATDYSKALWAAVNFTRAKRAVPNRIQDALEILPDAVKSICGPNRDDANETTRVTLELITSLSQADQAVVFRYMPDFVKLMVTYRAPSRMTSLLLASFKAKAKDLAEGTPICTFLLMRNFTLLQSGQPAGAL